jgi:hypothetical protein
MTVDPEMRSEIDKDLVFIVSGGRTGTTFFGNALNELVEDCYAVHEPDLMPDPRKSGMPKILRRLRTFGLYHMVIGRLRGDTGIRNLTRKRLSHSPDGDAKAIQSAIRAHRDFFYTIVPQALVVESYSQWFGLLPDVRAVYPSAKVVGIIRDPRDWVVSWLNYEGHHDARDMVEMAGQSRLTPSMIGDHAWADRWDGMSVFQKLCWDWKTVYGLIDDFAQRDQGVPVRGPVPPGTAGRSPRFPGLRHHPRRPALPVQQECGAVWPADQRQFGRAPGLERLAGGRSAVPGGDVRGLDGALRLRNRAGLAGQGRRRAGSDRRRGLSPA